MNNSDKAVIVNSQVVLWIFNFQNFDEKKYLGTPKKFAY
jgi:hypothetical protein